MATEKRYRSPVQLGVTPRVFKRLRQRAHEEGLSLAAWVRLLVIRELRRKKALF
jgi:hypothetical protein